MTAARQAGSFLRLFGTAVLGQGIISAGNFVAGLLLIRLTTDRQYGAYVLITATTLLISPLQAALMQPGLVSGLTRGSRDDRRRLVGGLHEGQRLFVIILAVCGVALTMAAVATSLIAWETAWILVAAALAIAASMFRDFFRIVLLGYRRPAQILRADAVYVALLVGGVGASAFTPAPAAGAALALAFASLCGGRLLARSLWLYEPWEVASGGGAFRRIAPLGIWAAIASGVHWSFTQGYSYLVAIVLGVSAVAGIAATRLLLMPIMILSIGVSSLMMPTATLWLDRHGPALVMRRLLTIAGVMTGVAIVYATALWLLRDWVFANLLKKEFADRDALLVMWSLVFATIAFRDQVIYLLIVSGRFKALAALTGVSGLFAIGGSLTAMHYFGVIGAPIGVLIGESVNLAGVAWMSSTELRTAARAPT